MYSCCNRKGPGIFAGYQAFWIIVVIAIVIIWVTGRFAGQTNAQLPQVKQ